MWESCFVGGGLQDLGGAGDPPSASAFGDGVGPHLRPSLGLHPGQQGRLVGPDGEKIVSTSVDDVFGSAVLAVHGIRGDHAVSQVEPVEQAS